MHEKSETIRGLDRGLTVIETLSRMGQMSLADLARSTGLPKPTLLRILATLQARNWVRRNIVEGLYELSHSLGVLLGQSAHAHPLAELSGPAILALKADDPDVPAEVAAVIAPGQVEVVESTRLRGPMAPTRTALGLRPSMVLSAHGRATLAFSPPAVAEAHLAAIARIGSRLDRQWLDSGRLAEEVARTKKRGFGLREPEYWEPPFDPGPPLGALALPIQSPQGLHGTMSLLWVAAEMSHADILARGRLDALRKAADLVGQGLARARIDPPVG